MLSLLRTNMFCSMFLAFSCIVITRCNDINNTIDNEQEVIEPDDSSLTSVTDQLQTVNPLIWIIMVLISLVCCLCTVLICYCFIQNKFNKEMAEIHRINQLTLQKRLKSFSSVDQTETNTLRPPLKPHHSCSNSQQSRSMTVPHMQDSSPHMHDSSPHDSSSLPKAMVPSFLPRSKSHDTAVRAISINIRPDKMPPNARHQSTNSVGNGYHQYVNSVRMWNNPVYHTEKQAVMESALSRHTANNMSLTIPTTYDLEYGKSESGSKSGGTTTTYITNLSSNPGSVYRSPVQQRSPVGQQPPSTVYIYTQPIQQQPLHSIPSQMSHDHLPPTPLPGTPPPVAMHNMSAQQNQSMIYNPHRSALRAIPMIPTISPMNYTKVNKSKPKPKPKHKSVPIQRRPLPKIKPKLEDDKSNNIPEIPLSPKDRLDMRLEEAMGALSCLTPPGVNNEGSNAWTEASMTGGGVTVHSAGSDGNQGIAGMMPYMFGNNEKHNGSEQDNDNDQSDGCSMESY